MAEFNFPSLSTAETRYILNYLSSGERQLIIPVLSSYLWMVFLKLPNLPAAVSIIVAEFGRLHLCSLSHDALSKMLACIKIVE